MDCLRLSCSFSGPVPCDFFLIFEDLDLVSGLRVVIDVIEIEKQEEVQTKDAFNNESEID